MKVKGLAEYEQYIVNYLPPKCISASDTATADLHRAMSFGAFRKVPDGVPRNYVDIDRVPNSKKWREVTLDE